MIKNFGSHLEAQQKSDPEIQQFSVGWPGKNSNITFRTSQGSQVSSQYAKSIHPDYQDQHQMNPNAPHGKSWQTPKNKKGPHRSNFTNLMEKFSKEISAGANDELSQAQLILLSKKVCYRQKATLKDLISDSLTHSQSISPGTSAKHFSLSKNFNSMTKFNSKIFKLEQSRKQKEHLKECFETSLDAHYTQ